MIVNKLIYIYIYSGTKCLFPFSFNIYPESFHFPQDCSQAILLYKFYIYNILYIFPFPLIFFFFFPSSLPLMMPRTGKGGITCRIRDLNLKSHRSRQKPKLNTVFTQKILDKQYYWNRFINEIKKKKEKIIVSFLKIWEWLLFLFYFLISGIL